MNRKEIIWVIKRNNHDKKTAITLISDFLVITKETIFPLKKLA